MMKLSLFILLIVSAPSRGQLYEETHNVLKTLLNSSYYSPQVRPLLNQSLAININVSFSLVSIVTVDDTNESFICNGFMTLEWIDEKIQWNPNDYGGEVIINVLPKEVWRPRVVLLNTLNDRDLFGDDVSPLFIAFNGAATWAPGSLFTTSCSLDLLKYPFDEQLCTIRMMPMGHRRDRLVFTAGEVNRSFYSVNGEWELVEAIIEASVLTSPAPMYTFEIQIRMRRRPTFYVLNIMLPFVFLSFLNLLVFTIPQESGEKIGYGITVLLALSVFFSIVGGMIPKSSNIVPNVVIYLFILYVISALTVVDSILIVFIYHVEEREDHHKKMKEIFRRIIATMQRPKRKIVHVQANSEPDKQDEYTEKERPLSMVSSRGNSRPSREKGKDERENNEEGREGCSNNNKALASVIDFYSAMFFFAIWFTTTLWYFISIS